MVTARSELLAERTPVASITSDALASPVVVNADVVVVSVVVIVVVVVAIAVVVVVSSVAACGSLAARDWPGKKGAQLV